MGLVWFRWRTELRSRWRALLVLSIAVGLGGGVALAAFAGARRADDAMSRFVAYSQPDTGGFIFGSSASPIVPPGPAADSLSPFGSAKQVLALPEVASWFRAPYLFLATNPTGSDAGSINPVGAGNAAYLRTIDRPLVVAGRLPEPSRPFDAAVNEYAAAARHLHVGSRLPVYAYSYAQIRHEVLVGSSTSGLGRPAGPSFTLTITAIVRSPTDVNAVLPLAAKQNVVYDGQQNLFLTPAFLPRLAAGLGIPVEAMPDLQFYGVRLRHGAADWKAFAAAATAIGRGQIFTSAGNIYGVHIAAASAQRGIRLEVIGLLLFGALALLMTVLLVGQAVARQVALEGNEFSTLRALGMTRRQLVAIVVLRAGATGAAGGLLAFALAALASPLFPIGLARQAEIHPGFDFDAAVLVGGFAGIVVLVCLRAMLPAWRAVRRLDMAQAGSARPTRAGHIGDVLARAGFPPAATLGVGYGVEPGQGTGAVPVTSALVGAVLAVVVLTASLTFGASLDHLLTSPRQQGWNWDVLVGNPNSLTDAVSTAGPLLASDRYVGAYSAIAILAEGSQGNAMIDHTLVDSLLAFDPLKGSVYPPLLQGHAPRAGDQIVLATQTLEQLHRKMGQWVTVTAPTGPIRLQIVGRMISPSVGDIFTNGLGDGGWVYGPFVRRLVQTAANQGNAPPTVFNLFAVRYAHGAPRRAAFASLEQRFGRTVLMQVPAEDVLNLQDVDAVPALLAGLVVLFGAMTVGNTLVTSVRRRRRDMAVLKTIGFTRGQVRAVVAWQATTFAVLALLVGLPVGIAAGRWAWHLVASGIGSVSPPTVPALVIAIVIPATLVVANVIAAAPAWSAARLTPGVILRSE